MPSFQLTVKKLAHGQVVLTVEKDGAIDSNAPHVMQQLPEDFVNAIIEWQKGHDEALEKAALLCIEKVTNCGKPDCKCWYGEHLAGYIRMLKGK